MISKRVETNPIYAVGCELCQWNGEWERVGKQSSEAERRAQASD